MTPSPCVLCNTHVKFDLFHQKALAIGAEKIATGHYARVVAGGAPDRTYVIDVNPFTKRVTVGPASALERGELIAEKVHWIAGAPPAGTIEVTARVRSRAADVAAPVTPLDGGRARFAFAQKLRAVAPGQAVVMYDDDVCLGGGDELRHVGLLPSAEGAVADQFRLQPRLVHDRRRDPGRLALEQALPGDARLVIEQPAFDADAAAEAGERAVAADDAVAGHD